MARYDVYRMPGTDDLLLKIQSKRLDDLKTRVAIPMVLKTPFLKATTQLHPEFEVDNKTYVMMTHYIASVPTGDLRQKLTNLTAKQYKISSALDMLFYGF